MFASVASVAPVQTKRLLSAFKNGSVNGCPGGSAGLSAFGSMRLPSSATEGNRQPLRPPTVLSAHTDRALNQFTSLAVRALAHTRPVSRSKTAALPILARTMNLVLLG